MSTLFSDFSIIQRTLGDHLVADEEASQIVVAVEDIHDALESLNLRLIPVRFILQVPISYAAGCVACASSYLLDLRVKRIKI
jgi:hypothetical protein